MMEDFPYYAWGAYYKCRLCGEILPDGVSILGNWNNDTLVGVRAEGQDGDVLHSCGEEFEGHDGPPADRVALRDDVTYATATGTGASGFVLTEPVLGLPDG